jgi:hypothetical protein
MENNASSVIIKVKDIDICRSFYRNILNMGDPVVNSNFRVEFIMGNNASLLLLQESLHDIKPSKNTPCIEIKESIPQLCARLDELECDYEFVSHADKDVYKMQDPENRLILFTGHSDSADPRRPKRHRTATHQKVKVTSSSRRKRTKATKL